MSNIVKFHQRSSYLNIFSGNFVPKNCNTVFFPGCSLSGYDKLIVEKTFNYLSEKIDNLGFLLTCCGKPSLDIKEEKTFNNNFKSVLNILEKNKIEKVIVACSNCYITLKKYTNIEVISLWEVIDNIGTPEDTKDLYKDRNINVTLHDPCPIRKETQIHESVRNILKDIGICQKEFKHNRDKTICCGAGGMMLCKNKELAIKLMTKRASSTESKCIVSYCESCVQSMILGGKKGLHLLDFLFNEDVKNGSLDSQLGKGTLGHWNERRKIAKTVKNLNKK